jgi:hypothetical protein
VARLIVFAVVVGTALAVFSTPQDKRDAALRAPSGTTGPESTSASLDTQRREARRERRRAVRSRRERARKARAQRERRALEHRRAREAKRRAQVAAATPAPTPDCDSNYEGACLDPDSSDYDCEGGSGDGPDYTGTVRVVGTDIHDLDRDGDGIACDI